MHQMLQTMKLLSIIYTLNDYQVCHGVGRCVKNENCSRIEG